MTATAKKLPSIRQLPPNLINQIAAGEVIERPASVVKELLENSIDAGASRIEVTVVGGGSELIRISDNGCGMTSEQLPLAVASHATSKLPDEDSLFHVSTLGFRGEALASVGSVSHLTIRSRTESDECGSEINVRGGVVEPPAPCGCPVGTVIEVRNLFFNTPVRHRFLKTAQTEKGHILEAFTRLALANPDVHFVLTHNDKLVHDLPATTRWTQRIHEFFGAEISEALIPISSDDGQIRISGHVCDPSVSRGNNRMQYLFLNGRHIRDRALQHALERSLSRTTDGRSPSRLFPADGHAGRHDRRERASDQTGGSFHRLWTSLQPPAAIASAPIPDHESDSAGWATGSHRGSGRVAYTGEPRCRLAGTGPAATTTSGDRLGAHGTVEQDARRWVCNIDSLVSALSGASRLSTSKGRGAFLSNPPRGRSRRRETTTLVNKSMPRTTRRPGRWNRRPHRPPRRHRRAFVISDSRFTTDTWSRKTNRAWW